MQPHPGTHRPASAGLSLCPRGRHAKRPLPPSELAPTEFSTDDDKATFGKAKLLAAYLPKPEESQLGGILRIGAPNT